MADDKGETNLHPSGTATPKGKLESLTKDDLVKFVKRQTVILQKLKAKNAELESQISSSENGKSNETAASNIKDESEAKSQIAHLEKQLNELQQEKDEAVEAYNAVQTSQERAVEEIQKLEHNCLILEQEKESVFEKYVTFEKINKNLVEEIDCLKMKDETLTSTLLCLQQEQTTLSENNKKLIAEKSDLQIKLEDLEEESMAWKTEKESLNTEILNMRSAMEESKKMKIENSELRSKLEVVENEKLEIQKRLENLEFNLEQRGEQVELLQTEICRLKNYEVDYTDLKEKLRRSEERIQQYEAGSVKQVVDPLHGQEQINQLLAEIEKLRNHIQVLNSEFDKQQNVSQVAILNAEQEKEQLNESYKCLQNDLEIVRREKIELDKINEEMIKQMDQLKINIDIINREKEVLTEKVASIVQEEETCEKPDLKLETAEIAQLETRLQEAKKEKENLLEKIAILEREVENSNKTESVVLAEKLTEIEKLTQDLTDAKSKLMDFEANLGSEFNIEVIQNLQQELTETKMKLSELESSTSMYGAESQGIVDNSGCLQQTGWSDLPDIEEEPENDQAQQLQGSFSQEGNEQFEHNNTQKVHQQGAGDGQVCVEKIDKLIKVTSHVVTDDSYQGGTAEEMFMLKARIAELEKENEGLRLKFEQLLEKNLDTIDENKGNDVEMNKHSEIIASLQAHRQHLEEKLVILGDKHETVTFELEELHAERESLKSEMELLQNQLHEWENMMGMLKEEKDCLAHELEDYTNKDASLRKELEFMLSSLNEAITERDTLQDEVFKLSQHEDSAQGDVKEMKSMIEDIIAERNSLLSELDKVLSAKADVAATVEKLSQELEHMRIEKEDIEREKESLLVRFHLAEDKQADLSESYEAQIKVSSEMEENLQQFKQQTEAYVTEIQSLKQSLDMACQQVKAAEAVAEERVSYSVSLENQILELSSSLSDSKKRFSNLKEQLDQLTSDNAAAVEYIQQIADLQNQQVEYQRSIEQLTSSVDKVQEERDQLSLNAVNIGQEVDSLKQQLSTLENEKAELVTLVTDLKMENANVEERLLGLQKDMEILTTDKMEVDKQLNLFQQQMISLDSAKESLQQELQLKTASLDEEVSRQLLLQEEISKQMYTQEDLETKAKMVSALEELVEQMKVKERELQDSLNQADEKVKSVVDDKEKLAITMEELLTSIRNLQTEKDEFQKQVKEWVLKSENVQAGYDKKQSEVEIVAAKLNAVESNLLQIRENTSTAETLKPDLVHQLQQLQAELQDVNTEIDKLRLTAVNQEDTTGQADCRYEQVIQQVSQVVSKLEAEKARYANLQRLLVECVQSQERLQLDKGSIDSLTLEKENILTEFKLEQNRAHSLEEQIVQKDTEILDLKNKVAAWEQENTNLVQQLEEINCKLTSACMKTSEMEKKYTELEEKCTNMENCLLERDAEIERYKEQINNLKCVNADELSLKEQNIKEKLELEQRFQEVITEQEVLKNQLAETGNTVKPLWEQVASLEQELEATRIVNNELLQQLNSLKEEQNIYVSQRLNNDEMVSDMNDRLNKSVEVMDVLTVQLEKVTTERDELVIKIKEAEKAVETLKQNLDVTQEERDSTIRHLETSVLEKEKLNSELLIVTKEKESLLSKLLISEEDVEQLKKQIAELEGSMDDLKLQIEESRTRMAALEAESKEKGEENLQKSSEHDSELHLLRKQLKEKEEINSKLKQLAIKTKKELGEKQAKLDVATKQVNQLTKTKETLEANNEALRKQSEDASDTLSQQFKNLQENYKKVQASLDAAQDEAEQEKIALKTAQKDIEQLVTQLTEARGQVAASKEEKEHLLKQVEGLRVDVKNKDSNIDELRTKFRAADTEMAAIRIQLEELNKEKQKVELKLSESESRLKTVEEEHKGHVAKLEANLREIEDQLNAARQSMKQNSMLDLEMADYERTISTLHLQVAEREKKVEELKMEIDKQEQTVSLMQTQIDAVEEQRSQADERANKLKAMLVKTKKDLADARQMETAQRSSDAFLRGQLENTSQQLEEYKIQVSQLTADNQKLLEKIRTLNDNSQRLVKSLESRVESLTSELQVTRSELTTVQAEYDSYKVRAHSVLRQQKSKNPTEDTSEIDKHEKERYENAIDHLKIRLQETQDQLQTARKDAEQLQEEHEHLIQRHTKLLTDQEERETKFRLRLENSMKEKAEAVAELQERIAGLETQKTFQAQKFKEQINKLKDENAEVMELLQKQLDVSEMDNIRLQREIQQLQRLSRMREESIEHTSPSEFYPITAHPVEERQEGEGSEIVELEPIKTMKPHSQPAVFTFEQLIATPMKELSAMKPVSPIVDEEALKSDLAASQKKIDHLTELLNESEESVSRLTEQARILKDEIRRLERNMEREKETQNMEYLKNIFLQFMCPKVGEQRLQLVPVLTTMLKLSPDEKARIQAVAQGDEQAIQGGQAGAGWGAYLHRWSGLT